MPLQILQNYTMSGIQQYLLPRGNLTGLNSKAQARQFLIFTIHSEITRHSQFLIDESNVKLRQFSSLSTTGKMGASFQRKDCWDCLGGQNKQ